MKGCHFKLFCTQQRNNRLSSQRHRQGMFVSRGQVFSAWTQWAWFLCVRVKHDKANTTSTECWSTRLPKVFWDRYKTYIHSTHRVRQGLKHKMYIHISQYVISQHEKDYFGLKCILSYYVPVQTIVSPYDANCVTPLIYPTTDLDFLFGIIVSLT